MIQHRTAGINTAVSSAVTGYIRDQKLRVGNALPSELAFAKSAGVSRTTIRETFGALVALQLIDVGSGRRARVGAVDGSMIGLMMSHAVHTEQASVPQVWDVRRALEQRSVVLATMQRSNEEARQIADHALAMRRGGSDLVAQTEHDIAFHAAIARASRNPIFSLLIASFADVMRETCPIGWASRRSVEERNAVFDQHDRIAEAILDRNPDASEQAMAMAQHFAARRTALVNSGYN